MVDIKAKGSVQKGRPYKCFLNKTGRVYSVTQHAVGIIVNKLRGRFWPRELICELSILSTLRAKIASRNA